jgi:hypothetical protein
MFEAGQYYKISKFVNNFITCIFSIFVLRQNAILRFGSQICSFSGQLTHWEQEL